MFNHRKLRMRKFLSNRELCFMGSWKSWDRWRILYVFLFTTWRQLTYLLHLSSCHNVTSWHHVVSWRHVMTKKTACKYIYDNSFELSNRNIYRNNIILYHHFRASTNWYRSEFCDVMTLRHDVMTSCKHKNNNIFNLASQKAIETTKLSPFYPFYKLR